MFYILSAYDYSALISLSGIPQNSISQAVFDMDINNRSSFTQAKSELVKLGLVKKAAITSAGMCIAEAILSPLKVVSVISCNSMDMATAHYCFANKFWIRLLPKGDHSVITIETPIIEEDLGLKIKRDFLGDTDFEDIPPIDITLSPKEILIFEIMQLALVDKVREKGAPLSRDQAALMISEFVTKKNVLDASAAALMLGETDGYDISKLFWDSRNVISHIDDLVQKGVFDKITETQTGKQKYIMSEMSRKWLTLDSLIDKITIQRLPEGDIINVSITKAGMMVVNQNKEGLSFKTVKAEELY